MTRESRVYNRKVVTAFIIVSHKTKIIASFETRYQAVQMKKQIEDITGLKDLTIVAAKHYRK